MIRKEFKMNKALKKFLPGLKSNLLRFGLKRLRKVVEACLAGPEYLKEVNWWSCIDYGKTESEPNKEVGYFRLIMTKDGDILRMYHMWIYPGGKRIVSSVQMESCGDAIVSKSEVTSLGRYRDQLRELGFPKSFLDKYPKEK